MFTGIVESTGTIACVKRSSGFFTLGIKCSFFDRLSLGESVAVNGVCLTVSELSGGTFFADVTPETFSKTSFSILAATSRVNLERAMSASGRFGGHIVTGHIDGTARVVSVKNDGNSVLFAVCVPEKLSRYIVNKGSLCIDGTSLTVASVSEHSGPCVVTVSVIPHTWANTVLCERKPGSIVNIECDIIGKYVEKLVSLSPGQNFSVMESLRDSFVSYH